MTAIQFSLFFILFFIISIEFFFPCLIPEQHRKLNENFCWKLYEFFKKSHFSSFFASKNDTIFLDQMMFFRSGIVENRYWKTKLFLGIYWNLIKKLREFLEGRGNFSGNTHKIDAAGKLNVFCYLSHASKIHLQERFKI